MKIHAFRLKPNQDLRVEIERYVREHSIKAWVILACVWGLERATLRLPGQQVHNFERRFEIVSIQGTLSTAGCYIHISLTDLNDVTVGGHLKEGCPVYCTAEVILQEFEGMEFTREYDEETGFKELKVNMF